MTDENTDNHGIDENGAINDGEMSVHPLAFDWAIYAHHLREADLTGEQQRQLIETLWTIATLFVDYGFGSHPVQQVCGEDAELADLIAEDVLYCGEYSNDQNNEKSGALNDVDRALLPEGVTQ